MVSLYRLTKVKHFLLQTSLPIQRSVGNLVLYTAARTCNGVLGITTNTKQERAKRNMDDVLTESPPPSRFFQEDLDNFATPPPPLPSPFLLLSPNTSSGHLRPTLLLVALSGPSLDVLHRIPHKTLIGSLILPEIPLAGNSLDPSPRDRSCYIYSANLCTGPAVLVAVQFLVASERARTVAKSLLGDIQAERVLILDSICSQNYRGRLSVDETVVFKLETMEERRAERPLVQGVDYFPSGSVMDGLGAAIIAECQMRRIKGTMVTTWPANERHTVVPIITSLLRGLSFDVSRSDDHDVSGAGYSASRYDSDLYT